jgi:mRNA-degrading endonuclease RelE of RelBE toxin-antitoxin system
VTTKTFGRSGHGDLKKLQGSDGEWRLRSGKWRVFVQFEGAKAYITRIDDRKDAY